MQQMINSDRNKNKNDRNKKKKFKKPAVHQWKNDFRLENGCLLLYGK